MQSIRPSTPPTTASSPIPTQHAPRRRIRCKMCKQTLATPENLTGHGVVTPGRPSTSTPPVSHPSAQKKPSTSVVNSEIGGQNQSLRSSLGSRDKMLNKFPTAEGQGVTSVEVLKEGGTQAVEKVSEEIRSAPMVNPHPLLSQLRSDSSIPLRSLPTSTLQSRLPSLLRPECSGYFVEPMNWMNTFLDSGEQDGRIVCPNERCKAKVGNYDWAGVRCGCKEWVVPGLCIHRSKVDEVR